MDNTQGFLGFVSVVMPVFREAGHLPTQLGAVRESLNSCNIRYEVVLVDDGSSDNTWEIIKNEAKTSPVRGLRLSRNFGKELALCAGLEHARGDAVILMDADGQHPPSLLPEMVRIWQTSGADIVEAVKRKRGKESFFGKIGALLFYFILKRLSGFDFGGGASDFKLLNRKAVAAWLKMPERNVFFRGMTAWMGFVCVRIPFEVSPRSAGQSTWSYFKRLKLALIGITAFSSLPLQVVTLAGGVFFAFSIILGAQALYFKIVGEAVSGFTTVILLELIIGSFLMISLGIIGEYLARIYEEVKGRPRYIVAEAIESASQKE